MSSYYPSKSWLIFGLLLLALVAAGVRASVPNGYMLAVNDGRLTLIDCPQYKIEKRSFKAAHTHHEDTKPEESHHSPTKSFQSGECPSTVALYFVLPPVAVIGTPLDFRILLNEYANSVYVLLGGQYFKPAPRAPPQ